MDLSDFYPPPSDLIKSELSVLNHLRQNTYIKTDHPRVAGDADNYFQRNRATRRGFEFNSHFDIYHLQMPGRKAVARSGETLKPNVRLIVSARIEASKDAFTNVTYCLAVCRIENPHLAPPLTVLRKFHFDVVATGQGVVRRRQQHPQCHLQYCGKMVPYMRDLGCSEDQLDEMHPNLSEPRIFFWPMTLGFLVDMALREFPDQASTTFRAQREWRRLVRGQEEMVLRPFYTKCVEIIDAKGQGRTLADAFYVS